MPGKRTQRRRYTWVLLIIAGGVGLLIVATMVSYTGVKEYRRTTAIDREIAALRAEAEALERMRADLKSRIAYVSSDAYKEYVAKERLSYRRSDEHVIMLIGENKEELPDSQESEPTENHSPLSPVASWWKRLFSSDIY